MLDGFLSIRVENMSEILVGNMHCIICLCHASEGSAVNMENISSSNVAEKQGEHRMGTLFESIFTCLGKKEALA